MADAAEGVVAAREAAYVVSNDISPDTIARSLEALLPARRAPIPAYRFTMLDTVDGRVRRSGARLTCAAEDGVTTLAFRDRRGGLPLTMRATQPISFAWELPDGPLRQALAPLVGVRRLLPQADAEEHGTRLDILDDQRKTVARLRIESGHARLPASRGTWRALPTMLTLTGLRGYEDFYDQLVPVIESRPGLTPCPHGVDRVILQRVGSPTLDDAGSLVVDLAPDVRADAGAREIHRALLRLLVANEPGVRASLDTEFLHDFRVAVRRTRSLLRQLEHVFPANIVEHFSSEFAWLGRLTGPVRDMDVLILSLRTSEDEMPAADRESLIAILTRLQEPERQLLLASLDGSRYRRLIDDWKAWLERPVAVAPGAPDAGHRLVDVVSRRAWRLSRRIATTASTIDDRTDADQLHAVRIDAKKLRYLIDVTAGFFDPADLDCVQSALRKLQRVLGDFNDARVQAARLIACGQALASADGDASAALALGRLAEQRRHRADRLRGQVVDQLAHFCGREARRACRRAFKRAPLAESAR